MAEAPGLGVRIDPASFYQLKKDLDRFNPALTRALRKNIRDIGNRAVGRVKDALREDPPGAGADMWDVGSRAALIGGTRTAISFSKNRAGVRIVTYGTKLGKRIGFLKAYNTPRFRHPTFGQEPWVQQQGRPYFGVVIQEIADQQMRDEMEDALRSAFRAIGAKGL